MRTRRCDGDFLEHGSWRALGQATTGSRRLLAPRRLEGYGRSLLPAVPIGHRGLRLARGSAVHRFSCRAAVEGAVRDRRDADQREEDRKHQGRPGPVAPLAHGDSLLGMNGLHGDGGESTDHAKWRASPPTSRQQVLGRSAVRRIHPPTGRSAGAIVCRPGNPARLFASARVLVPGISVTRKASSSRRLQPGRSSARSTGHGGLVAPLRARCLGPEPVLRTRRPDYRPDR